MVLLRFLCAGPLVGRIGGLFIGTPTSARVFQALSFRYTRGKDLDMAETLYARAGDFMPLGMGVMILLAVSLLGKRRQT